MQITLYRRSFPVKDAPVAYSLVPYSADQRHTYAVGGKVFEAVRHEIQVVVPDNAKIDAVNNRLVWIGDKGSVKSTGNEVFGFAEAGVSGFGTVK
jgi:hypothetical protein